MRVGIIGAGRIGGGVARQAARAGHELRLSARDLERLRPLAEELGEGVDVATPAETAAFADVLVLSVPWDAFDDAVASAGPLDGTVVVDTTNQYGHVSLPLEGATAAAHNAARLPGGRYVKSFNTLTAAFQAEAAARTGDERAVQWLCGDDEEAKALVAGLIEDLGYAPVDLGGTAGCAVMEAPRRPGAVYGEEYRVPDAAGVVEAVRAGRPIPPTPSYG